MSRLPLLLAAALCWCGCSGGDEEARRKYEEIERTIVGASSLRVRFVVRISKETESAVTQDSEASGTLLLKNSGRAKLSMKIVEGGREDRLEIVSDGSQKLCRFPKGPASRRPSTPALKPEVATALARGGVHAAVAFLAPERAYPMVKEPRAGDIVETADYCTGAPEEGASTILYKLLLGKFTALPSSGREKVQVVSGKEAVQAKMWYRPATCTPVRRTFRDPNSVLVEETFEEFSINPDIPDSEFSLPPE